MSEHDPNQPIVPPLSDGPPKAPPELDTPEPPVVDPAQPPPLGNPPPANPQPPVNV
jgi:hypothetical protein